MPSIAADILVALVALVTAIPAAVVVRPSLGRQLYGLDVPALPPAAAVIVLHRAVFFAIVAALLATSIVVGSWRAPALFAAVVSKLAFVALAQRHTALAAIIRADAVLVAMLLGAAALDAGSEG